MTMPAQAQERWRQWQLQMEIVTQCAECGKCPGGNAVRAREA